MENTQDKESWKNFALELQTKKNEKLNEEKKRIEDIENEMINVKILMHVLENEYKTFSANDFDSLYEKGEYFKSFLKTENIIHKKLKRLVIETLKPSIQEAEERELTWVKKNFKFNSIKCSKCDKFRVMNIRDLTVQCEEHLYGNNRIKVEDTIDCNKIVRRVKRVDHSKERKPDEFYVEVNKSLWYK